MQKSQKERYQQIKERIFNLYNNKGYGSSIKLSLKALKDFPDKKREITLWLACLYCRIKRYDTAISLLKDELSEKSWWSQYELSDEDLNPIRKRPEFRKIEAKGKQFLKRLKAHTKPKLLLYKPNKISERTVAIIALHGRYSNAEDLALVLNSK